MYALVHAAFANGYHLRMRSAFQKKIPIYLRDIKLVDVPRMYAYRVVSSGFGIESGRKAYIFDSLPGHRGCVVGVDVKKWIHVVSSF